MSQTNFNKDVESYEHICRAVDKLGKRRGGATCGCGKALTALTGFDGQNRQNLILTGLTGFFSLHETKDEIGIEKNEYI